MNSFPSMKMKKPATVAIVLAASIGAAVGLDHLIGTPTGKLDYSKKKHLEKSLQNNVENKATAKDGPSMKDERELYLGSMPKKSPMNTKDDRELWYYPSAPTPYSGKKAAKHNTGGGYYSHKVYGKGKGKGKGKGGKKTSDDCHKSPTIVYNPFNDHWEEICDDDDCEMIVTEEHFAFDVASATAGDGSLGTLYVWESQFIQDSEGNSSEDTMIQGTCIRTAAAGNSTVTDSVLGSSAQCSFTVVAEGVDQVTFGGVISSLQAFSMHGQPMAITGGSGHYAGIIGDATIHAVGMGGDPLDDATRYEILLTVGLIVCPAQYFG